MIKMELELHNSAKAKLLSDYDKTIALLTDERPGFLRDEAIRIGRHLQELGYYVYEIGVKEFTKKNLALIGAMTVIPHAQSVPVEFAQAMKHYWLQGGKLLVLGGPMFCELVEEEEGQYVKKPLPPTILDAQHSGKTGDIVIEGLIPTHKVYIEQDVMHFTTEPQHISTAHISAQQGMNVVCPVARPHGSGFAMEHRSRFIPIIDVKGESGRDNGNRGAAAFIMLNDTRGHLRFTNGSRPGSVSATVMGSAYGCIGIQNQELMDIPGVPTLIGDMVNALFRGLFLYEGGASEFVYAPNGTAQIGARILNTNQDFVHARLAHQLSCGDERLTVFETDMFLMPRTYTDSQAKLTLPGAGNCTLETKLYYHGQLIDSISQQLFIDTPEKVQKDDFVSVSGRDFMLHGKQWNMLGISYWPLYYPSFDREDYWMGWLDKSNYDPVEVEKDLELLEGMGLNCIFTRLDGNIFGRSIAQLKDFIQRLKSHGMKLSLSYANATNPLHYSPDAFRLLMDKAGLHNNPVLFGHDISWEIGHQYFMDNYLPQWTKGWIAWIEQRYGSVERAEKDWGVSIDRDDSGDITHPPKMQLEFDGEWRVKICAFRRYMDDMLSRVWNDAVSDMRRVDSVHIIGYRMGCFYKDGGGSLTSTNKHMDYSSLEGYSFMENEDGRFASQCVTKLSQLLTNNKPVVWVEYGNNLIGTSGNSAWSALKWDREKLSPLPEKIREQNEYYQQFFRMFRACDVAGSVPWWFAGGFRRVECSDCGMVAPNGTLRPVAELYKSMGEQWFLKERQHRQPTRYISYDPDSHSAGWGKFYLGSGPIDRNENSWAAAEGRVIPGKPEYGPGVHACREAEERGEDLAVTSPGFGTDSALYPVPAVGNVPYNGSNPPKYLDAEFNYITLVINGKEKYNIRSGDMLTVPKGASVAAEVSVGNLREAKWLTGSISEPGCVCLSVDANGWTLHPIECPTGYLEDARIAPFYITKALLEELTVSFEMEAVDRAHFGERWSITLKAQ